MPEDREAKEREIAEKLLKNLTKAMLDVDSVEPLGDLNVPVKEVLSMLIAMREVLSPEDARKMLLIVGVLYGCKDEHEFMLRLAKTMKDLTQSNLDMEVTSEV